MLKWRYGLFDKITASSESNIRTSPYADIIK